MERYVIRGNTDRELTADEAFFLSKTDYFDNPALMSDFYKQCHAEQYNGKITKIVSYETFRMNRLKRTPNTEKVIVAGIQRIVRKELVNYFNKNFFGKPEEYVVDDYVYTITHGMTDKYVNTEKIRKLHRLGYLPLRIRGFKEGTRVPIKVPVLEISNTLPEFAWCTNFVETLLSNQTWYPCEMAGVYYNYRAIAKKYYDLTVDDEISSNTAISEFGFRGSKMTEAGIVAGMAALLSFTKTATIPALKETEYYYNCRLDEDNVGKGMISTEHSVMCSNTAIDGNEVDFLRRLITEIYPTGPISIVSDSYNYWRLLTEVYCKELKQDILEREGIVFPRGDSGDPIDIICGEEPIEIEEIQDLANLKQSDSKKRFVYCKNTGAYYKLVDDAWVHVGFETPVEVKGTVQILWEAFEGTINSKGFKVLNSKIKCIYGDSITQIREEVTYARLMKKGFAANNVALGSGSFSAQCVEEIDSDGNSVLMPLTRDTHGMAIKATYAELTEDDGTIRPIPIFKDPATDTGNFKKSQRGLCYVYLDSDGEITYEDGYTYETLPEGDLYVTYFENGRQLRYESIMSIRDRLWEGNF